MKGQLCRMLIINADDYGLSSSHNEAILRCFRGRVCSSATIMPNMPAFEEACNMAHEYKFTRHIGMHLVLRDGPPLTDKIKRYERFCNNDGLLNLSRQRPVFYLSLAEKEVLAEEMRAQIKRCRHYEIPITHIDSHHHIHTEWAVADVLIPIVREQNIPYIRIGRNTNPNVPWLKTCYKYIFNMKLHHAHMARTRYFGSLADYLYIVKKKGRRVRDSFEIMIHPSLNENNTLVDGAANTSLSEAIQKVDSYVDAVSFSGMKYNAE
jgi:predicted glycoside hydrolase/deacetylase ChbG (UPF0249 family)